MRNCTLKITSPYGDIFLYFENGLIKKVKLGNFENKKIFKAPSTKENKILKILKEFENYFKGEKEDFNFSKKMIDYKNLKDFQKKVFKELLKVNWGKIVTYSELAEKLGNKNLKRAIGQALKRNPFPIIIPCHRVIGKKGLTGFSGGLEWKRKLLEIEGIICGKDIP